MLTALQLLFIASGLAGLAALAMAYRWRPRLTRDGVIFLLAAAMAGRGIVDARPDLFGAGFAGMGLVPAIRGTIDKAKDSADRGGAP